MIFLLVCIFSFLQDGSYRSVINLLIQILSMISLLFADLFDAQFAYLHLIDDQFAQADLFCD